MRVLLSFFMVVLATTACAGSSPELAPEPVIPPTSIPESSTDAGPGGYGFDRSDPQAGIANIMEAFATDEATATCVFEAWGDVANVPPAELTPELMAYRVCGTSILEMITGRG